MHCSLCHVQTGILNFSGNLQINTLKMVFFLQIIVPLHKI
ncbi:hypothetical protein HMPREF0971_01566 [Segatella oris F0302]|uniref:Uncharacterized protein n=1 Tax=Segatella oris F0302 TaxID=649760 RepID=D1QRG0_9BACT|nr:hypothetical protein HMPREF0971_01566 [Segatella oris F0302]